MKNGTKTWNKNIILSLHLHMENNGTKTFYWNKIFLCHPITFFWEMKAWSSHVPRKMMQDIGFVIKFGGNLGSTLYKSEKKGKCFMFLCHFLRILKRRNICFWHKKCAYLAQKMFPETHVFVPKRHKNTCFLYV